jgi:diguanylate cyclase (GGDEF)-like protein/PAS domain S-box-containing protein
MGSTPWDEDFHASLSRTLTSILFVVSGLVQWLIVLAPHPDHVNDAGLTVVGLISFLAGIAVSWLPLRFCTGIRAFAVIAPGAIVLTAVRNYFWGPGPDQYSIFHIVSFVWLGIACGRGAGLAAVPILITSYIAPMAAHGNATPSNIATLVTVVPVCVLISETLAWIILRLRSAEGELERQKSQAAVERAETRYRALVEQLPSATYILRENPDDLINSQDIYISPQIETLLGIDPETWVNTPGIWNRYVHPDDRARIEAVDIDTYVTGEQFSQEYRMVRDDGRIVWVLDSCRRIDSENPDEVLWLGEYYDITGLREAEQTLRETNVRYQTLVEQIPLVTYVEGIAEDGFTTSVDYISPQIEELLGYAPNEWLVYDPWERHVHPDDLDWLTRLVQSQHQSLKPFSVDYRLVAQDGRTVWVHDECAPIFDDAGRPKYWHGYLLNITQIKEAERQLRQSEAEFRLLFFNNPLPAWVFDRETHTIVEVNEQAIAYYGYSREEFIGLRVSDLVVPGQLPARNETDARNRTYRHRTKDGRQIEVETTAHPLTFHDRPAMLVIAQDVTARNALQAQLTRQAFHDTLTGLPNRALFRQRLDRAMSSSRDVTVIFVDLDDFKRINDSLGHTAGDAFLVAIANRLTPCLREGDTIARLGGDEFTVLLERCTPEDALAVVERFYEALRLPISIEGREMVVSPSIGIAIGDETISVSDELLRRADVAMYVAKRTGKSRHVVFAPEMDQDSVLRLDLEADLRRAIQADQLELYYQPVIDIRTGALRGLEALVRWNHPAHGLISPASFIPLAEETGLVVPLGGWVLGRACAQLRAWNDAAEPGDDPLNLSVNISARQLQDPRLLELVSTAIRESGVDPDQLTLEVTESVALHSLDDTDATLRALRERGVRLAIDDFGTGYSGLRYLQQHQFDVVKIDRSYIRDITDNAGHEAFLRAVLAYATTLGVDVVAEGVETPEQLEKLREIGVSIAQGFYYSRPIPAAGIDALRLPRLARIA